MVEQEAERRSATSNAEAADKAVLAVEKPQNNVRQAFNGGQNGRFLPAPKILANLFRRDDRPKEDKSWLDRVTDAIIDKLELRWEEDEEARIEVSCFVIHPLCRTTRVRNRRYDPADLQLC